MNEELVSVVITTYKRSDKIEDAIKSVLSQTYKNLEIIVVDDNSNAVEERIKTENIVNKYKQIKYIKNKENLGGALSRNVGIDNSNGKYIAFLDDDDKYVETKIEKQYKCYLEHKDENVGLIYCYYFIENKDGEIVGEYGNNQEGNRLYENMINCIANTSLWFTSKEVLIDIGKFEDSPCKQDSILLLKLLGKGYKVFRVPEKLAYYYEHGGNGISDTKPKNIQGLKIYRQWSRKYYNQLTKKQIKNVEYNFSKNLITLYIINNLKKEGLVEFKNMIKIYPFKRATFITFLKFIFSKLYLTWLGRKK